MRLSLNTVHSVYKIVVCQGRIQSSPLVAIVTNDESESGDDESRTADHGNPKHDVFLRIGVGLLALYGVDIHLDTARGLLW